ncbi:hypothetical protein GCM10027592_06470 [Spirosoma flavus]
MVDFYNRPSSFFSSRLLLLIGLLFGLTSATVLAQTIRYVKPTASGLGNGSSWENASSSLQTMIDSSTVGDQVWVAAGTYKPTSTTARDISFTMKNGVAIYGGFAGSEMTLSQRPDTMPSSTTLSGDIGTVGDNTDNSFHIVVAPYLLNATAILDGFVITAGNANTETNNGGAGMINGSSSPLIRRCFFVANRSIGTGGAIYNSNANPKLINCSFLDNVAGKGGAIGNYSFAAGVSSPQLINCSFQNNTANQGGAIYNYADFRFSETSPTLTNCSFQGNSAEQGGAVYSDNYRSSSLTYMVNCVLWNNGGANTFVMYGNYVLSYVALRYSLIDASATVYGAEPGTMTTTTTPFASTTSTVLSLTSLAINSGDPSTTTATVGTTDLAGNPRFTQGRIDMGAYETVSCDGLVTSVKDGNWDDPTIWNCNVVPSSTDIVLINHVVTLPASYTAQIKTLRSNGAGKLLYQTDAKLELGL